MVNTVYIRICTVYIRIIAIHNIFHVNPDGWQPLDASLNHSTSLIRARPHALAALPPPVLQVLQ